MSDVAVRPLSVLFVVCGGTEGLTAVIAIVFGASIQYLRNMVTELRYAIMHIAYWPVRIHIFS